MTWPPLDPVTHPKLGLTHRAESTGAGNVAIVVNLQGGQEWSRHNHMALALPPISNWFWRASHHRHLTCYHLAPRRITKGTGRIFRHHSLPLNLHIYRFLLVSCQGQQRAGVGTDKH